GTGHPLVDALAALRSDLDVDRVGLTGLGREAVAELVLAVTSEPIAIELVGALTAETAGNPLFLRELLIHLLEERRFDARGPDSAGVSVEALGIPDGVRDVIRRRLERLPEATNRLLAAASGCPALFRFGAVAAAADLDEGAALDALDAALAAQLVRPTGEPETYEFTHALIRDSLYTDLKPSRCVRLHRRLAREIERHAVQHAARHALEIAGQWHRSAPLPGAEDGVPYCLVAADHATHAAAYGEEAAALRMALDLAPNGDPRRPRFLARRGLALALSLAHQEAGRVAGEAGWADAATDGRAATADPPAAA